MKAGCPSCSSRSLVLRTNETGLHPGRHRLQTRPAFISAASLQESVELRAFKSTSICGSIFMYSSSSAKTDILWSPVFVSFGHGSQKAWGPLLLPAFVQGAFRKLRGEPTHQQQCRWVKCEHLAQPVLQGHLGLASKQAVSPVAAQKPHCLCAAAMTMYGADDQTVCLSVCLSPTEATPPKQPWRPQRRRLRRRRSLSESGMASTCTAWKKAIR
jgi:hypothetical protein